MFSLRYSFFPVVALGGAVILFGWFFLSQKVMLQFSGRELSWMGKLQEEKQDPTVQSGTAIILFGGDMQFDRYIRSVAERRGGAFIFDGLRSEFQKADLVVANLEGPITDNSSVSETSLEGTHNNYVFTFPVETAALLKQENVRLVNIGNNHILNFKEEGVEQTKKFLKEVSVDFFGSPIPGDERVNFQTLSGTRIAFVNYNEFIWKGQDKTFEDIASVKDKVDFVVVYTHWGKEYVEATPEMKMLAHEFVDAGADLIIGSHPHVIQATEEYQGKWIYYSLGNLIFDQYFRSETQSGLIVRAVFDPSTKAIMLTELPIQLKTNGQTEFVPR